METKRFNYFQKMTFSISRNFHLNKLYLKICIKNWSSSKMFH